MRVDPAAALALVRVLVVARVGRAAVQDVLLEVGVLGVVVAPVVDVVVPVPVVVVVLMVVLMVVLVAGVVFCVRRERQWWSAAACFPPPNCFCSNKARRRGANSLLDSNIKNIL